MDPWRLRLGLDWMAVADADGDGDEDVYAAGLWIPPHGRGGLRFNRWRQVWGLPTVPRGAAYRVEVCGRRGTVFAVALAAQRLATPLDLGPLGSWHLDPARSVSLGTLIMGIDGTGNLPLPIPNLPFLAGKTFYTQAIDLDDGTRVLHATGWWSVRVL